MVKNIRKEFQKNGISAEKIITEGKSKTREEMLKKSNGMKTIPQIFIENFHVGGYEELRDLENKEYLGKSVLNAVKNINGTISKNLNNFNIFDQRKLDNTLNIWKYSPLNEAERIAGMLIPRILNS